jgi:hypothetical protein
MDTIDTMDTMNAKDNKKCPNCDESHLTSDNKELLCNFHLTTNTNTHNSVETPNKKLCFDCCKNLQISKKYIERFCCGNTTKLGLDISFCPQHITSIGSKYRNVISTDESEDDKAAKINSILQNYNKTGKCEFCDSNIENSRSQKLDQFVNQKFPRNNILYSCLDHYNHYVNLFYNDLNIIIRLSDEDQCFKCHPELIRESCLSHLPEFVHKHKMQPAYIVQINSNACEFCDENNKNNENENIVKDVVKDVVKDNDSDNDNYVNVNDEMDIEIIE